MDSIESQISKKIRFIAYFSYFFATTQLVVFIGAIISGVHLSNIVGSLFNVGIWGYIGYALLHKKQQTTYWIAVAFLLYIILSGLGTFVGFYFLFKAGAINAKFAAVSTYSLFIFIGSVISLYLLRKREVRDEFYPSTKGAP